MIKAEKIRKRFGVKEALGETKEGSGSYLYDMGENVSGVPVITIPEELAHL